MKAIPLTEEMVERKPWAIPTWLKVGFYTVLGAMCYQGGLVAYTEGLKAYKAIKHNMVFSVISEELDSITGDLTPAQEKLLLYKTMKELKAREATLETINAMSVNIVRGE